MIEAPREIYTQKELSSENRAAMANALEITEELLAGQETPD